MRFEDKVVYQIYPKPFQDSNGDGWGISMVSGDASTI